jgi:hypothetical protein
VYEIDDDIHDLVAQDRVDRWARKTYWCCDGQWCGCGGLTVAEMADEMEEDDE